LKHANGSTAQIYLNGAHITSYRTASGKEVLFMSTKAVYQEKKPLRGGIPVCWPQFGPLGSLPQHGFARNSLWSVKETHATPATASDNSSDNSRVSVTLFLEDSAETRSQWNNAFRLEYQVTLHSTKLSIVLRVSNRNPEQPFTFTGALHTYFSVGSVHSSSVHGLQGLTYIDKMKAGEKFQEQNNAVTFTGETDRVYIDAPDAITIQDSSNNTHVELHKNNMKDCVVWNAWIQKAKDIADLGDDDWLVYVCAEAAVVNSPVTVAPNTTWEASQEITAKL